jgi:hypothetical protein
MQAGKSLPEFERNVLPPSWGLMKKPSKQRELLAA